jgi:hypothetical protein
VPEQDATLDAVRAQAVTRAGVPVQAWFRASKQERAAILASLQARDETQDEQQGLGASLDVPQELGETQWSALILNEPLECSVLLPGGPLDSGIAVLRLQLCGPVQPRALRMLQSQGARG